MEKIIVHGGHRLEGTVEIEGAKMRFCRFWLQAFLRARAELFVKRSDSF